MQNFFDKRSLGDAIKNENKNVCSIATRTMKFLKSEPGEVETKPCNHFSSEEDDQMRYIQEYHRYFKFWEKLRAKLKEKIKKPELIKALVGSIKTMKNLTIQERKLFESEESITKLLENPMLEIVMSIKELDQEKTYDKPTSIKHRAGIMNSKRRILAKQTSINLIESVSKDLIKDSMTNYAYQLEKQMAGKHRKGLSKRQTFVDLPKLISETKSKVVME